jgi:chromosome segregation ATPase
MSKQVKQYIGRLQNRIANQRAEIERLHKEIKTLTIKCNAWHLTAERVGEELQAARANVEILEIYLKDFRSRNKELQTANEGLAKQCEEFEAELQQAHNIRTEVAREIVDKISAFRGKLSSTIAQYEIMTLIFDLEKRYKLKNKHKGD